MSKATLITGADGYIGMRVARRLMATGGEPLMLWVRSADRREFDAKVETMKGALAPMNGTVSFHTGDLAKDDCFASLDRCALAKIVHCAAVTRFNVDAQTA